MELIVHLFIEGPWKAYVISKPPNFQMKMVLEAFVVFYKSWENPPILETFAILSVPNKLSPDLQTDTRDYKTSSTIIYYKH